LAAKKSEKKLRAGALSLRAKRAYRAKRGKVLAQQGELPICLSISYSILFIVLYFKNLRFSFKKIAFKTSFYFVKIVFKTTFSFVAVDFKTTFSFLLFVVCFAVLCSLFLLCFAVLCSLFRCAL